jgi:exopolyphosphatase/guanosine-5'-triphosphate,3'-diphosphate pyrophosphatase
VPRSLTNNVVAAIDIGTNAVRLKLGRVLHDGSLETLHEERDPVRPGEGVFKTRVIRREVADRLLSTLRRYAAMCKRHRARVRAVATSAVREARNRDEILKRIHRETGLEVDVVSGKEEARLVCLGVLRGKPKSHRSLLLDVGGGSTEVAIADGENPQALWSLSLGSVRMSETFDTSGPVERKQLQMMRQYAAEAAAESLPRSIGRQPRVALGSSGTFRAIITYAAAEGTGHVTRKQLSRAVEEIAIMTAEERRTHFDARRAEIIVGGAVVVEALVRHFRLESVTAVESGLRDGLLVDLLRRRREQLSDPSLTETIVGLGRRFDFDESHGRQVAALALQLFDGLARLHRLPAHLRPLLEAAALLHDLGHAVNYQRHHRHTFYLIQNADLPGLADHQRLMVARIARYHRGSPPEAGHATMDGLSSAEVQQVRRLAMLLRLADCFDRSHHQPVRALRASLRGAVCGIRLVSPKPVDLEMWDAQREASLFTKVFHKRLELGRVGR